jgi:hypothetical protein
MGVGMAAIRVVDFVGYSFEDGPCTFEVDWNPRFLCVPGGVG